MGGRQDQSSARTTWALFGICQSMLANPTSTAAADVARRDRVRQRVVDFNAQLAQACAAYGPNCDFDDNAVFNYPFAFAVVHLGLLHDPSESQRDHSPARGRHPRHLHRGPRRGPTPRWDLAGALVGARGRL